MLFVLNRAPAPDMPYWPGRRILSLIDSVIWPAAWALLLSNLPEPVGVVGPAAIALLGLIAAIRTRRAVSHNQRYRFTACRWLGPAALFLLVGLAMKGATMFGQ